MDVVSYFIAFNQDGMYFGTGSNMTYKNYQDPPQCGKSIYHMDQRCQEYFQFISQSDQNIIAIYPPSLFMQGLNNKPNISFGFCKKVFMNEALVKMYKDFLFTNQTFFSMICNSIQQNKAFYYNSSNNYTYILYDPNTYRTTQNAFNQDQSQTLIQLTRQVKYFQQFKNHKALGICYNNIGNMHFCSGRFLEALQNYIVTKQNNTLNNSILKNEIQQSGQNNSQSFNSLKNQGSSIAQVKNNQALKDKYLAHKGEDQNLYDFKNHIIYGILLDQVSIVNMMKIMNKHQNKQKQEELQRVIPTNKLEKKFVKKYIIAILEDDNIIEEKDQQFQKLQQGLLNFKIELCILIKDDKFSTEEESKYKNININNFEIISYFYSEKKLINYLIFNRCTKYHDNPPIKCLKQNFNPPFRVILKRIYNIPQQKIALINED
ncbi:hypothetical protein ABPG74_020454 [Tetrahymena malaccensis]